jgi:catechol 2,3-dioxygenase-like lactoylglutathione lyase family enzyme
MPDLFHVGLTVRDVEKSIRFYCDVVGMEEAQPMEHASAQFDKLTSNPGARLKVVMLKGGSFCLQLIQYLAGGGDTLRPHHNNVGSPHFAFFVPDVAAKYKEIEQRRS